MRQLLLRDQIQARLTLVFPREAFDPVLSNPLATAALAAMLYVDAVVPDIGDGLRGGALGPPEPVLVDERPRVRPRQ